MVEYSTCLGCGSRIPEQAGVCPHCGVERLHCFRCGYDLAGSPRRCPECGAPVRARWTREAHEMTRKGQGLFVVVGLIVASPGVAAVGASWYLSLVRALDRQWGPLAGALALVLATALPIAALIALQRSFAGATPPQRTRMVMFCWLFALLMWITGMLAFASFAG